MVTKVSNSVLNLINPAIDNMVLLEGTLDNVVIGSHVPSRGFFNYITVTSLVDAPLVGASSSGLLEPVFVGAGLMLTGDVLSVVGGFTPSNDVLREDGSYLLREDGSKILREHEGP